jgi:3(or 17)beta-hydroxysteroid dehydrogenase
MGRVAGKIAIVTGAASGIGFATAELLAGEGGIVVLTDQDAALGSAAAQKIQAEGGRARFLRHDVSSESAWEAVVADTLQEHGQLDVLVNNAGIAFPNGSVEDQSLEQWRRVMTVNADGVFLGTKHAMIAMRRSGAGSIVNVSSIMGIVGSPGTAAYTASKGAVRTFTKSAALHGAKIGRGIRVNSVHPGYVMTPLLEENLRRRGSVAAETEAVQARTPLGHLGEPRDIAYGILYLASDEARFVTGSELVIDGGYLAQ